MPAIDPHPASLSMSGSASRELLHYEAGAQQQPDPATDDTSSSPSSDLPEAAVAADSPQKLLADGVGEEDPQAALWQCSGTATLVTNDLFQQLPDRSMARQQAHQWQANDIFETQASIAGSDSAGRALSAASEQYSSLLISSRSSNRSVDSSHSVTESEQHTLLGIPEQHDGIYDVDENTLMLPISAFKQHTSPQQQQVFRELFDTQLSQILTSQDVVEDMFGSSTDRPSRNQVADAGAGPEPVAIGVCSSTTDLAADSILVNMHSAASVEASGSCLQPTTQFCEHLHRPAAAVATDTPAGTTDAAAEPAGTCAALSPCVEHQETVKHEPSRTAVSTAQLEVMGWDMFADTLGTFRLLSDTDSDVESTVNLLPEPAELGPVTPEAAEHQLEMNHGWYLDHGPAAPCATGGLYHSDCHDDCHSQGQGMVELIDSTEPSVPAETYVVDDHVSCLEREFHSVMADRQGLMEIYPGMSSDAEEFDGDGTGCLGRHASCAGRVEQCVTCNSCATCSCYPYAALRPGKRQHKSKLKRMWASVRNTGAACTHPKCLHESYT